MIRRFIFLAALLCCLGRHAQADQVCVSVPGGGQRCSDAITDANNAAFSGFTDMPTDSTIYTVGRSFEAECTVAGFVKVTMTDGSSRTVPLNIGLNILPYQVKSWTLSAVSGGATCTYANLN